MMWRGYVKNFPVFFLLILFSTFIVSLLTGGVSIYCLVVRH
jgi:hypothetical protein